MTLLSYIMDTSILYRQESQESRNKWRGGGGGGAPNLYGLPDPFPIFKNNWDRVFRVLYYKLL